MADPISPSTLHPKFFAIPVGIFFVLAVCRVDNMIGAVLALFSCLIIVLTRAGMEFSADNHFIREYYSLLEWRFGRWESLPTIVGVTVKYFSEASSASSSKYSWKDRPIRNYEKLVVMLSVKDKSTGIIIANFSTDDVNAAIYFANDIAEEFGVSVNKFLPTDLFNPL